VGRGFGALLAFAAIAAAAEVVWLDGHREQVGRVVVKGDRLLLPGEKGMRSVATRRVVRVIGEDGEDVAFDRALRDGAPGAETAAMLASLPTAEGAALRDVQDRLADSMSRAVMERLSELARDRKPELRARAGVTLLLMGTSESLAAGLGIATGDGDAGVRRRVASALFAVLGALGEGGLRDGVAQGLADRDPNVKATCALVLGRLADERARDVLKASCLKSSDHHVRESAAEVLAELGDDAGVGVLVGMLSRTKHPGGPDLPARIVLEEKVRVCELLRRLKASRALDALRKAARAKEPELAAAAQRAIDAIGS
jgi:HEAT repeat protein